MTQSRTVLLTSGLLLALCAGAAQTQPTGKPMLTLQMPALPDPVRVALKPATTALLVLDFVDPICTSQPKCKGAMLPAVTPFLAQARKAGVVVTEQVPHWVESSDESREYLEVKRAKLGHLASGAHAPPFSRETAKASCRAAPGFASPRPGSPRMSERLSFSSMKNGPSVA